MSFTFSDEAEKWSFPQKTHCIAVDPLDVFSCGLVNSVDVVAGFPDFPELEKLLNGFTLSVVALICSVVSLASISFRISSKSSWISHFSLSVFLEICNRISLGSLDMIMGIKSCP